MRGILFAPDDEIRLRDIGGHVEQTKKSVSGTSGLMHLPYKEAKEEMMRRFHEEYIKSILESANGNVTQAARKCGLERQALQQLMRRYNLRSEDYR
jgi:DNA-binding NtrC family response regulator